MQNRGISCICDSSDSSNNISYWYRWKRIDSLPKYIKRRKDGIEIILLFNAYQLENKRKISNQEEEQLAKKENIKYFLKSLLKMM